MKKLLFTLNICLVFCFANTTIININKPTDLNQTIYKNIIETPFGFSIDLQYYNNVIWISNISDIHSIILSDCGGNRLILNDYPFGVPLGENLNIYNEKEFIAEIQNPTSEMFKAFYSNSTFYIHELNDGYKAYISTSTFNDDILASVFQNSKFIVSFFLDSNDKKIIENILYSIRRVNTPFSKENYLKNIKKLYDNGNLQKALLYSSIYYVYDKNNKKNKELLNKITDKIIFDMAYIKSSINE
jgi:hypothetical protein